MTSLRSFTTLPNGISFLYCGGLTLTGAHSLFPDGMASLIRSPVLGAAIPLGWASPENLDQLLWELMTLAYFPVSLIDIFLITEIFFFSSYFQLPPDPPLPFAACKYGELCYLPRFLACHMGGLVLLSIMCCLDRLLYRFSKVFWLSFHIFLVQIGIHTHTHTLF